MSLTPEQLAQYRARGFAGANPILTPVRGKPGNLTYVN